jgi:hypothetical protein
MSGKEVSSDTITYNKFYNDKDGSLIVDSSDGVRFQVSHKQMRGIRSVRLRRVKGSSAYLRVLARLYEIL